MAIHTLRNHIYRLLGPPFPAPLMETNKNVFLDFLQNEVLKQKRDDDMRARMVLPSVNDPNVLVLQGVKKAARGNYSCRVGNGIPTHNFDVESEPIFLDVKCE